MLVYMITDESNNKKYIGQTNDLQSRLANQRCTGVIKKFNIENYNVKVLYESEDEIEVSYMESFYIKQHNTMIPNGYNTVSQGYVGNRGISQSEETKEKISKAMTGSNNPMYGKSHSEELRKSISDKMIGKMPNTKTIYYVNYETNSIIGKYRGLSLTEEATGVKYATIWSRLKNKLIVDSKYFIYEEDFGNEEYYKNLRYSKRSGEGVTTIESTLQK